jgi:hypothetical protein
VRRSLIVARGEAADQTRRGAQGARRRRPGHPGSIDFGHAGYEPLRIAVHGSLHHPVINPPFDGDPESDHETR